MSRSFTCCLLALLLSLPVTGKASVIASKCTTPNTDLSHDLPNSWMPTEQMLSGRGQRIVEWLSRSPSGSARFYQVLDDLRLYWHVVNVNWGDCVSKAKVIIPVTVNLQPGLNKEELRVGYKVCDFYQDDQRQIIIDQIDRPCRFIGDSSGYTLAEIDKRFVQFRSTVDNLSKVVDGGIVTAGLVVSLLSRRAMRRPNAQGVRPKLGLTNNLLTLVPTAAGLGAVVTGVSDLPIQDVIDLRDSAKLLFEGKILDVVRVEMPIEEFIPLLEGYLGTIHTVPLRKSSEDLLVPK